MKWKNPNVTYSADSPTYRSSEREGITFRPRGLGSNWLPCFICGGDPKELRTDMAAFVKGKEEGEKVVALFKSLGLTTTLDWRESEPLWCQVKTAACPEHVPSLKLLMDTVRNPIQVSLVPRVGFDHMHSPMDVYGDHLPHPALFTMGEPMINESILKWCLPDD